MVSEGEGRTGPPQPRGSDRSAANPIAASFSHARVDRHRRPLDRRPREHLLVYFFCPRRNLFCQDGLKARANPYDLLSGPHTRVLLALGAFTSRGTNEQK